MGLPNYNSTTQSYPRRARILLLLLISSSLAAVPAKALWSTSAATDRLALLAFKSLVTSDPSGILSSWGNETLPLCQWPGVTCAGRLHPDRVAALDLRYADLTGPLSPHLSNLTFLTTLRLEYNNFVGPIPSDIGRLSRLKDLNLSMNHLNGEIPASLTRCSKLMVISLWHNLLTGEIPRDIGALPRLQWLRLGKNNLTGTIPPSMGNISSLLGLGLNENSLEGHIPLSMGKLSLLRRLDLSFNNLSGAIPWSLYNLSSIWLLMLVDNQFVGSLPPNMFNGLPNLQLLLIGPNQLSGQIPISLTNASNMVAIQLASNFFTGNIPSNLGKLGYLHWMHFGFNQLEASGAGDWDFLASLANCSQLEMLKLSSNRLGGILPASIGNLSTNLKILWMAENLISGSIPNVIGNLLNLTVLDLTGNRLTGAIPSTIGRLQLLGWLSLSENRLSGQIPYSIGNLEQLINLNLDSNNLNGTIPSSLGNLKNLQELNISQNGLTGSIPKELLTLSSLSIYLDLSHNSLTGSLLSEVGKLTNLNALNISHNRLSGEIPNNLGNCRSLVYLHMPGNLFQGTIPQSLSNLKGLEELDLSRNNLSGGVPTFLGSLGNLLLLDLSFNNLQGQVPNEGVFQNASEVSLLGNNLCGGHPQLRLPSCDSRSSTNTNQHTIIPVLVSVLAITLGLIIFFVLLALYRMKQFRKKSTFTPIETEFAKVSYAELLKSTDGFSASNLIGVGSFGSVYKGTMTSSDSIVAVKVLNLQLRGATKSFLAECKVLKDVRHRNLLKILTVCSSVDFKGDDFKALVLEFMPNGSLEKWLHPEASESSEERTLSLVQRLNIAIDVASALEYLHHYGQTPIVHCDLKPNNVLLDNDMGSHVADFGLARFLSKNMDDSQTMSTGIKGTIGYIAPEYGMGCQASTNGDVYSYGVLLLELFTGKRPTDDMFTSLSLRKYVEMAFPERVMEIIDARLLLSEDDQGTNDFEDDKQKTDEYRAAECECLVSVIGIGLSCAKEDPRERMEIRDITNELFAVRDVLLKSKKHEER